MTWEWATHKIWGAWFKSLSKTSQHRRPKIYQMRRQSLHQYQSFHFKCVAFTDSEFLSRKLWQYFPLLCTVGTGKWMPSKQQWVCSSIPAGPQRRLLTYLHTSESQYLSIAFTMLLAHFQLSLLITYEPLASHYLLHGHMITLMLTWSHLYPPFKILELLSIILLWRFCIHCSMMFSLMIWNAQKNSGNDPSSIHMPIPWMCISDTRGKTSWPKLQKFTQIQFKLLTEFSLTDRLAFMPGNSFMISDTMVQPILHSSPVHLVIQRLLIKFLS